MISCRYAKFCLSRSTKWKVCSIYSSPFLWRNNASGVDFHVRPYFFLKKYAKMNVKFDAFIREVNVWIIFDHNFPDYYSYTPSKLLDENGLPNFNMLRFPYLQLYTIKTFAWESSIKLLSASLNINREFVNPIEG